MFRSRSLPEPCITFSLVLIKTDRGLSRSPSFGSVSALTILNEEEKNTGHCKLTFRLTYFEANKASELIVFLIATWFIRFEARVEFGSGFNNLGGGADLEKLCSEALYLNNAFFSNQLQLLHTV